MSGEADERHLHPVPLTRRPLASAQGQGEEDTLLALLMGALLTHLQSTGRSLPAPAPAASPQPVDMAPERPLALSVAEAAKLLRVSRTHVYELIRRDELPSVRLGRRVVVPRIAVKALLEGVANQCTVLNSGHV